MYNHQRSEYTTTKSSCGEFQEMKSVTKGMTVTVAAICESLTKAVETQTEDYANKAQYRAPSIS